MPQSATEVVVREDFNTIGNSKKCIEKFGKNTFENQNKYIWTNTEVCSQLYQVSRSVP